MLTLLIFLAVLSLLVFVHEWGHFIAARRLGAKVEEFGFGFPPRLFGWKRGETTYSINWIPLGGFVKLKGEAGEFAHDPDSFSAKPIWKRVIIVAAGVTMNFFLAFVLFTIGLMMGLPQATEEVPAGARVRDAHVAVGQILPDSPAAVSGLAEGDVIMALDGESVTDIRATQKYISGHDNVPVRFTVKRLGGEVQAVVTPRMLAQVGRVGVGVGLFEVGIVSYPWYLAPIRGAQLTASLTIEIVRAFGHVIGRLVTTGKAGVDVSGPVGIAVLTGRAAALGIAYLLQFTAILSLNLGIINFLPIPALDGGRFLFLAIEKIRRKPVPRRAEAIIHQIGFALLLTMVLIVTYRDLVRFSDTIVGGLKNLF